MVQSAELTLVEIRELLKVLEALGLTEAAVLAVVSEAQQNGRSAFGDIRTSPIKPVAGWTFQYGVLDRHVVTTVTGGATSGSSNGRGTITVSGASQTAQLATRKALRYVPGMGGLHRMTCVWNGDFAQADLAAYAGIGDDENGFFIGYLNGTFGFLRRTGGVEAFTPWNQFSIDAQLETGEGPTGILFNPARGHPFQIQYQWLGYGAITLAVENPVTGSLIPVHRVPYAGTSQDTSIRNPTLPPSMEITSGAGYAGGAVSLLSPSAMAFTEGDQGHNGGPLLAAAWNEAGTQTSVGATPLPVISLTNLAAFNTVTNRLRSQIVDLGFTATVASGAPRSVEFAIYRGTIAEIEAALTGEAFADVDAGESCMQVDTTASAVNTAGLLKVWQEREVVPGAHHDDLHDHIAILPGEGIIVTAALITGSGAADAEASIRWREPI
jgi:hypothetical protein